MTGRIFINHDIKHEKEAFFDLLNVEIEIKIHLQQ